MIYEYLCKIHGEFEVSQKISDEPLSECPKCKEEDIQSEPPQKLISKSSFILQGGGWAADKYSK